VWLIDNLTEASWSRLKSVHHCATSRKKFPDPYSISLQKGLHLNNGQDTLQLKQSSSSLTTVKPEWDNTSEQNAT